MTWTHINICIYNDLDLNHYTQLSVTEHFQVLTTNCTKQKHIQDGFLFIGFKWTRLDMNKTKLNCSVSER